MRHPKISRVWKRFFLQNPWVLHKQNLSILLNRKQKSIYVSNHKLQETCQIWSKVDLANPVKMLQSPEGSHYWQIFSLSTFWQNICWHKIVIKLSLWSNFRFLRIKKSFDQLSSSVIWRPPPLTLPPYSQSQICMVEPHSILSNMYPTIFIFSSFLAHNIIKRVFFYIIKLLRWKVRHDLESIKEKIQTYT